MGHQILIIALTGTHNPALPAELVQQLGKQGFEIRHACLTYEGQTTFAVGTPEDLASELTAAGHELTFAPAAAPDGDAITLATINANVLEVRRIVERFERYEKKDDKAAKQRPKKNEGVQPETKEPETKEQLPETAA